VSPRALVVAVVWEDEVLAGVPTEPHDAPVAAAVTPRETLRLPVLPRGAGPVPP